MSVTTIIILSVVATLILGVVVWSYLQARGAKKFDEHWEKMSEEEKRSFEQNVTSTKLG